MYTVVKYFCAIFIFVQGSVYNKRYASKWMRHVMVVIVSVLYIQIMFTQIIDQKVAKVQGVSKKGVRKILHDIVLHNILIMKCNYLLFT